MLEKTGSAVLDEHFQSSNNTTADPNPTPASDSATNNKPRTKVLATWESDYDPIAVQYAVPITSTLIIKETSEFLRALFIDFVGTMAEWKSNVNANNQTGMLCINAKFQYTMDESTENTYKAVESKVKEATKTTTDDISAYNAIRFGKGKKDIFITDELKSVLAPFVPDQIAITNNEGAVISYKQIKNNKGVINWDLITSTIEVPNPIGNGRNNVQQVIITLDGLKLYKEILCHGKSIIKHEAFDPNDPSKDIARVSKFDGWTVQLQKEFEQITSVDVYGDGVSRNVNVIRMRAILFNDNAAKEAGKQLNYGMQNAFVPNADSYV